MIFTIFFEVFLHKEIKSKENLCTSYVHANALEQNKNVYRKEVVRQEKLMQRVVDIIMCASINLQNIYIVLTYCNISNVVEHIS